VLHGYSQAGPCAHLLLDLLGRLNVDKIAGCPAYRIQRLYERHARSEHGGERTRPACHGRFSDDIAKHWKLQEHAIHGSLHPRRTLPCIKEEPHTEPDATENKIPVFYEVVGHRHDEQRGSWEIGAEA